MQLKFETKEAAINYLKNKQWLEENTDGTFSTFATYTLESWESARPDYIPHQFADGWGIMKQYHVFAGSLNAPKNNRCNGAEMGEPITCLADLED
jgi:hypothetical protein